MTVAAHNPSGNGLVRWMRRRSPSFVLFLALVPGAAAIVIEVTDFLGIGGWCRTTGPVTCGISGNVFVAILAGAVAYVALRGIKTRRAIRHYQETAINAPEQLVRWAPRGEGALAHMRDRICKDLVDDLVDTSAPELVVVKGRDGVGKTTFLIELTRLLGAKDRLPLPISLRDVDNLGDIGQLSRDTFVESIDAAVASEGDADSIWRWARRTRAIVVLVDDLDASPALDRETRDVREDLESALREMRDAGMSIVLTSTANLELEGLAPIRVDLDGLDQQLACTYVRRRILELNPKAVVDPLPERVVHAMDAIRNASGHLHPSAMFHLARIAELEARGLLRRPLPDELERRRTELLQRWLDALRANQIKKDRLSFGPPDDAKERARREAAHRAAEELGRRLFAEPRRMGVPRDSLAADKRAVDDAIVLGLIQESRGQLLFPTGAVHAYFVSQAAGGRWRRLLTAAVDVESGGRANAWLTAPIVWAALHPRGPAGGLMCEAMLAAEEQREPRARIVAAAARLAGTTGRHGLHGRLADCAMRVPRTSGDVEARRALVDACARLAGPEAARVLWHFCVDPSKVVELDAARALIDRTTPDSGISEEAERLLESAKRRASELKVWNSLTCQKVGSLAWVLPSLWDAGVVPDELFDRTADLCLNGIPCLQGEVALARGLKMAVLRDPASVRSATKADELLRGDHRPEFWLARLLLVQALTVSAWAAETVRRDELWRHMRAISRDDPQPFVREAAAIGQMALEVAGQANGRPPSSFVWELEREAVSRPPSGAGRMNQLAADAVLVVNLIYERARMGPDEATAAIALARTSELPRCLGRSLASCDGDCRCGFRLCDRSLRIRALQRPAAPFSAAFCREQTRIIRMWGVPPWDTIQPRRRTHRKRYWRELADLAGGSAGSHAGGR